jgi:hypothetical protein
MNPSQGNLIRIAALILIVVLAAFLSSCAQDIKITSPRYALVYGLSVYNVNRAEGVSPNLTYSDDDAALIAGVLQPQGWQVSSRIFGSASPSTTAAAAPSKANIFADIDNIATTLTADSIFILYFSGHGSSSAGIPYIDPYGAVDSGGNLVLANCINPTELSTELAKLPTKKIIVIFDTCFSGGFVNTDGTVDIIPQNFGPYDGGLVPNSLASAFSDFGNLLAANAAASGEPAPIFISAAGSLESSYDNFDLHHGTFTWFFYKAASEGDSNGDGVVTATEAYSYAVEKIKSDWNAQYYNQWDGNSGISGAYMDFYPHISGGARDLVLFVK